MNHRKIHLGRAIAPGWWRALVVACAALSMCACRTPFGKRDALPEKPPTSATTAISERAPFPQPIVVTENSPAAASPPERRVNSAASNVGPPRTEFSISDSGDDSSATNVAPANPIQLSAERLKPEDYQVQQAQFAAPLPPALPETAYTGAPPEMVPSASCPAPYPQAIVAPDGQWIPPDLPCPWPRDEYIFDGGDRRAGVEVRPNWDVDGLDQEDTVVHYDTIEGETIVQPSNCVKIYAPRFAAVRKVTGAAGFQSRQHLAGAVKDMKLVQSDELTLVGDVTQPLQPGRNVGLTTAPSFRETTRGLLAERVQGAIRLDADLEPYEDFLIVRRGQYDNSEKARLAHSLQAAVAWTDNIAMQVVIGGEIAAVVEGDAAAQSTYLYEMPKGKPRIRICKLASRADALPGEIVEFTIRFDNVGDQVVGNVTIIDSLTTRLEYVEESQACNLKSNFMTQPNDGDSLVLRWEVIDPLPVGEGGVIRFKCRVR